MRQFTVVMAFIALFLSFTDGFHGKFIAIAQATSSQQPDEIAKEINKELRSAEKNMFSGKNEVADTQLEKILAKLNVLKELNPEHKKIKSLETKYERTRKAIDKKLGRTAKVASGKIRGLAKKSEVKESSGKIRGLAKKSEVKESSGEIRGLAKKSEVKESSGEIRGLAKKSEVKESSGEIRGLAKKSEVKESSGEIRGLAKKSEVKESSGEIRGLAKKSEVKESSGVIRGLAKKSEVKESSGVIRGLAKKSEVKESSGEIKGLAKKSEVKESSGVIKGLAKKSEVKESSGVIKGLAKKSEVTKMPAASASQPAAQSASTEKLPYKVRQLIKEAKAAATSAEGKVEKLKNPRFAKLTLSQKTKMVDNDASRARTKLEQAIQLAAAEGITDHPDFSDLTQRLATVDALVTSDTAKADKQEKEKGAAGSAMRMDLESLKAATEAAEKTVGKYVGKIHYNKLEEADAMFTAIEKFEKNDKPAFLQLQKEFGEKYGTTREEIDAKGKSVGFQNYETPSLAYLGMTEFIQEIDQGRVAMAEDLATRSAKMITGTGRHEFTVREDYQDARNWLSLAAKFAPDNALVRSEQKTIDSRIDAGLKAFFAKIDARTWPPKSAGGGSSEHQSVAKDYFVQSKDWAKREKTPYKILDLMVSGPWSVQKKDLFNNPIMYGLPVIVAVQKEVDKKDNLARVFHLTLRTPESTSPKTAPPFTSDTVGNSYFIRKSAL